MLSLILERVKGLFNLNQRKNNGASNGVFGHESDPNSFFSQKLLHSIYEVKKGQSPGVRSLWKHFCGIAVVE